MKVIPEGTVCTYLIAYTMKVIPEGTVCTYLIAYTMKVIPEAYPVHLFDSVHNEGYSRSVPCALIW